VGWILAWLASAQISLALPPAVVKSTNMPQLSPRHSAGADQNTCPPVTGCRVPQVVKERRTARLKGGHVMNADALKKLTTESLNQLAALLRSTTFVCVPTQEDGRPEVDRDQM
jgi:hypothetical protein